MDVQRKRKALSVCFLEQVFREESPLLASDFEIGPVRKWVRAAERHADACPFGNLQEITPIRTQRLI